MKPEAPCKECAATKDRKCHGDIRRRQCFLKAHADTRIFIRRFNELDLAGGPNRELGSNFYELLKSVVCVSIHSHEEVEKRVKKRKTMDTYGMTSSLTPILTESRLLFF